jgi:hypothetical protein
VSDAALLKFERPFAVTADAESRPTMVSSITAPASYTMTREALSLLENAISSGMLAPPSSPVLFHFAYVRADAIRSRGSKFAASATAGLSQPAAPSTIRNMTVPAPSAPSTTDAAALASENAALSAERDALKGDLERQISTTRRIGLSLIAAFAFPAAALLVGRWLGF